MKVYIASNMATDYPYKLQKPSTINTRVRDTAESFIMDSGIGDDVSNEKVLDLSHKHNADYVVAKDYLHDHEQTTESIAAFLETHESHETDAKRMCPLQPPHDEHYEQLETRGLTDHFDYYVLGGMAVDDVATVEQIEWIQDFRKVAPDVYAHGLGVGGGMEFVTKVAGRGLLDSVDCSTPEQAAMFGCVLDQRLRQREVRVGSGDGVSKRNKALAELNSWQLLDVWEREIEAPNGLMGYQ